MVQAYLENTEIAALKPEYSVTALKLKYAKERDAQKAEYGTLAEDKKLLKEQAGSIAGSEKADFDEKELADYTKDLSDKQSNIVRSAATSEREHELLDIYGDAFAHLYQIRENSRKFGEKADFEFKEIEQKNPVGIMTQEQYFEMAANQEQTAKQLALQVTLDGNEAFNLLAVPYDKPGKVDKQIKMQFSMDDKSLQNLNAEKMAQIMEFCEGHGLSVFNMDIPYSYDGSVDIDAKFDSLFKELHKRELLARSEAGRAEYHRQEMRKEVLHHDVAVNKTSFDGVSNDLPLDHEILADETEAHSYREANSTPVPQPQGRPKPAKKGLDDAEKGFEEFFEKGLGKVSGFSYFKEHTGWFGRGWTEYIVYDVSDSKNRKKDGRRDKNGDPKFTYSFKIFMKEEKDGQLRFAYRTPNRKKVDDSVVNGMVGQFKSLGITHVRFPDGLPDAEKKLWRIALAENGIVPKGMGLDKAKAEGMLKAAKEKLSAEKYSKFKYKLALQMEKDNISKGKTVDPSEQSYIDSLKNAHFYEAFTEGYGNKLKSMLRDRLDAADVNRDDGAVEKVAAYRALRRLFDAYKETVYAGSILESSHLSDSEKQNIRAAGLVMPVHQMNEEQMGQLFELMMPESKASAKKELDEALLDARDVNNLASKGAKRADNVIIKEVFDGARSRFEKINEMLKSLGVEEIDFPKAFGRLHYDNFYREHPEFRRRPAQTNTPPTPTPTPTPTPGRPQEAVSKVRSVGKKGNLRGM